MAKRPGRQAADRTDPAGDLAAEAALPLARGAARQRLGGAAGRRAGPLRHRASAAAAGCGCSTSRSPSRASGSTTSKLVVCTHSHSDHYGLAASICEQTGCELWMHPKWEHIRLQADDPQAALERAARGGEDERRPDARRWTATASSAAQPEGRRDRRHPRPRPRARPRGRGGDRRRHLGRSTRPPATRPRTSACTSPSAGC